VRIGVGLVVVLALAYVWLPRSVGYWIPLSMLFLGIIGGFAMKSRWAIPLSPLGIVVAGWLHQRIACADCPPATDPTLGVRLVFTAIVLGLVALGAWAGVVGSQLVSATRSSE
jgi:hypothetical protein